LATVQGLRLSEDFVVPEVGLGDGAPQRAIERLFHLAVSSSQPSSQSPLLTLINYVARR
jgi:hypothetical protein